MRPMRLLIFSDLTIELCKNRIEKEQESWKGNISYTSWLIDIFNATILCVKPWKIGNIVTR